ncbi:MAG: SDR family oxidoreductase, partial [bacterium]
MSADPEALFVPTALVTGASRGIGAAIARRLAKSGARVALLARSAEQLHALTEEIGGNAIALPCDVRDSAMLARTIAALTEDIGGAPDIIVNNAGAFFLANTEETSVDAFAETLSVNLTAPFAVVRALLPIMREANAGHIVTIGSVADRMTFPGNAAYAASKFGLRALHEVMRSELRG